MFAGDRRHLPGVVRRRPAAPRMSAARATGQTDDSVTLGWRTDAPSTSSVLLGTSPEALAPVDTVAERTRTHRVTADGLKPHQRYFYRVVSKDSSGHVRVWPALSKAPATFTTRRADSTAPQVRGVRDASTARRHGDRHLVHRRALGVERPVRHVACPARPPPARRNGNAPAQRRTHRARRRAGCTGCAPAPPTRRATRPRVASSGCGRWAAVWPAREQRSSAPAGRAVRCT